MLRSGGLIQWPPPNALLLLPLFLSARSGEFQHKCETVQPHLILRRANFILTSRASIMSQQPLCLEFSDISSFNHQAPSSRIHHTLPPVSFLRLPLIQGSHRASSQNSALPRCFLLVLYYSQQRPFLLHPSPAGDTFAYHPKEVPQCCLVYIYTFRGHIFPHLHSQHRKCL